MACQTTTATATNKPMTRSRIRSKQRLVTACRTIWSRSFGVVLVALALLLWRPQQFAHDPAQVGRTRIAILVYMVVVAVFARVRVQHVARRELFAHYLRRSCCSSIWGRRPPQRLAPRIACPTGTRPRAEGLLYAMVAGDHHLAA